MGKLAVAIAGALKGFLIMVIVFVLLMIIGRTVFGQDTVFVAPDEDAPLGGQENLRQLYLLAEDLTGIKFDASVTNVSEMPEKLKAALVGALYAQQDYVVQCVQKNVAASVCRAQWIQKTRKEHHLDGNHK